MAFKISPIADQVEYDSHLLQVVYSHLKMRQLNQKINGQIGLDGGLSNSMMGTGLGGGMSSVPAAAGQGQSFGNKGYDMVYNVIKGGMDDAGVNRDAIFQQVRRGNSPWIAVGAPDLLSPGEEQCEPCGDGQGAGLPLQRGPRLQHHRRGSLQDN